MALRASATARPHFPPPASSPSSPPKVWVPPVKIPQKSSQSKTTPLAVSLPTSTTLSLFALFTIPHDAKAVSLPKEQIVSSLNQVESTIDQVQEVGSTVIDVAGQVIGTVVEAVKPGIDVALPFLQQAGEQALKIASPAISEASKKAQEAIQGSGFDTQPVVTVAKTVADAAQQTTKVIEGAKPIASSTMETISAAGPVTIIYTSGALLVAYLLLPPVFSVISFGLRGYKGALTPAQTLDAMCTKNYIMIDIRSEKDKNKAGIPRLPSAARNQLIAIPSEELPGKLRSQVRSPKKVEAELMAIKISYLKKINKSSNLVILDSYSDTAKMVAKTLTNLGFKNTWIVTDGFSGSQGWLQSRLGTDSYNISLAQVLSPSRIIPTAAARRSIGTTSSTKLLPE